MSSPKGLATAHTGERNSEASYRPAASTSAEKRLVDSPTSYTEAVAVSDNSTLKAEGTSTKIPATYSHSSTNTAVEKSPSKNGDTAAMVAKDAN